MRHRLTAPNHDIDQDWPYIPYAPCPCGSGHKAKFCCRAGRNRWNTKPRWSPSALAPTGYDHPSCFAQSGGTCSHALSREHYISEAVLKLVGDMVRVSGLVFSTSPDAQSLSTNSFAAKILCKAHNEFLSPLDQALKRFVKAADGIVRAAVRAPAAPPNRLFLLNGNDIEYALLKMTCGLSASGAVRGVSSGRFDTRWPRILLGQERWPRGWGLYAAHNCPDVRSAVLGRVGIDSVELGLKVDARGIPARLGMLFSSWHLVFHASDDLPLPEDTNFRYRPDLLIAEHGGERIAVLMTFSPGDWGGFVRMTIHSRST